MNNKLVIIDQNGLERELILNNESIRYQKNNARIGDIGALSNDITKTIKVPKTPQNIKNMGFLGLNNNIVNTDLKGILFDNGAPTFRDCIIHNIQNSIDNYEIVLKQGNANFLSLVDGLSLQDLDFSELLEPYTAQKISDLISEDAGFLYPIIDTGNFKNHDAYYLTNELFPALYYSTIFDKISSLTGWTFEGNVFEHDLFVNRMIMCINYFANDTIRTRCNLQANRAAARVFDGTLPTPEIEGVLDFNGTVITDYYDLLVYGDFGDPTTYFSTAYRVPSNGTYTLNCSLEFLITTPTSGTTIKGYVYDEIFDTTTEIDGFETTLFTGTGSTRNFTETFVELEKGQYVFLKVNGEVGSVTTISNYTFKVYDASFENTTVGLEFPISENLPDIKISNFLKDFVAGFNLIVSADPENKILTFNKFNELSENIEKGNILTLEADLLKERNLINIQNNYEYSGLGKVNEYNFLYDKKENYNENKFNDSFDLTGQNYSAKTVIYKSLFAGSETSQFRQGETLRMKYFKREEKEVDDVVKYFVVRDSDITPRIIYLQKSTPANALKISDTGSVLISITENAPLAKFNSFLDGSTMITNFFSTFEASLDNPSTPSLKMNIGFSEFFNEFNRVRPLFFEGAYYFIVGIDNFQVKKKQGEFKLIEIQQA